MPNDLSALQLILTADPTLFAIVALSLLISLSATLIAALVGLPFGALRQHVDSDKLTESTLHAELGQIVAHLRPGRESDEETILFWHRGLSLSDIALGSTLLRKARANSIGQTLRFQ